MSVDKSQKKSKTDESKPDKGIEPSLPGSAPIISKGKKSNPNPPAPHDETNNEGQDARPKWVIFLESIPQWQNAVAAIVLGIFAILSSIGSIMSACAAEDSADAAIENIRILKISVKADIAITELYNTTPEPFNDRTHDRLEATFYITNTGQTPATDVRDSTYIEVRPKDAKIIMPKSVDQSEQFSISANTRYESRVQSVIVLSKEQIAGVENGDLKIFLWGKIAYKDIFSDIDSIIFCFEYNFEQKKFQSYSNYETK